MIVKLFDHQKRDQQTKGLCEVFEKQSQKCISQLITLSLFNVSAYTISNVEVILTHKYKINKTKLINVIYQHYALLIIEMFEVNTCRFSLLYMHFLKLSYVSRQCENGGLFTSFN
jgi:hypothetical protein